VSSAAPWLRRARRAVLLLSVGLAFYAYARFDIVRLPSEALSPLYGIHPGDRLLIDRHARAGSVGEAWLYRGARHELLLGRAVRAPRELPEGQRAALAAGALWLTSERAVGATSGSDELGPIPRTALEGRVLLVLPW
jgi:hypothetical protein